MIIIDRILNGFAVCEKDGKMENIPLSQINGSVREGDVLCADETGARYSVSAGETKKCRDAISQRFERIKNRNK